jgi:hypothetical protein
MVIEFNFKRGKGGWVEVWPSSSEDEVYIAEVHKLSGGEPKRVKIKSIWGGADRDIRNLLFNQSIERAYFFGEELKYEDFPSDEEWEVAVNAADEAAKAEALEFLRDIVAEEVGRRLV